jgi:hypothetical protein
MHDHAGHSRRRRQAGDDDERRLLLRSQGSDARLSSAAPEAEDEPRKRGYLTRKPRRRAAFASEKYT